MGNLEEMDKFLVRYNLLKLNQQATEDMNRPIISMEIKTTIKKKIFQQTKVQNQMAPQANSMKSLEKS